MCISQVMVYSTTRCMVEHSFHIGGQQQIAFLDLHILLCILLDIYNCCHQQANAVRFQHPHRNKNTNNNVPC